MEPALGPTQWVLLLHSVPHLGEKTLTRLLRASALHRVAPEEWLALSKETWQERYGLDPRAAEFLTSHREALLAHSAELARTLRAHRVQTLTCDSLTYPARVERFDDAPPPVLYALGCLGLLEPAPTRFTFTTALSNGASAEALETQDRIATALAAAGGIVVTGHDRPPYQRLALAAQRQGLSVIYLLDRGLREALGPEFDRPPFAAARIRDAVFAPERDLALSPFRPDDHSLGANNRRRDRLIFALSDLIVAVDVAPGGNMETNCRRAAEQRIPVFVAPGGRAGCAALRAANCSPLPDGPDWVAQIQHAMRCRS